MKQTERLNNQYMTRLRNDALRKFHRLTGMLGTATANLGSVISEGRCCDLGNFSRTRLFCKRLFGSTLAKARSGLVPVFQRPE